MNKHDLVLYHSPQTRGSSVVALLEELGVQYELKVLDRKKGENHSASFLAINPLGKFPTLVHNGTVVTEQVACYVLLADLFPEKGLAPSMDDPLRGAYLRWIAFAGSTYEPAVVDHALKRDAADPSLMPYGSYSKMLSTVYDQLEKGPFILGDRMYAVDLLWCSCLKWCRDFGVIETNPTVDAYIERIFSRPSFEKAMELDQALLQEQAG